MITWTKVQADPIDKALQRAITITAHRCHFFLKQIPNPFSTWIYQTSAHFHLLAPLGAQGVANCICLVCLSRS